MEKTVTRLVKCPYCGSYNTTICDIDEIKFYPDGTGTYISEVYCYDCSGSFCLQYNFKYEITSSCLI